MSRKGSGSPRVQLPDGSHLTFPDRCDRTQQTIVIGIGEARRRFIEGVAPKEVIPVLLKNGSPMDYRLNDWLRVPAWSGPEFSCTSQQLLRGANARRRV
jgi:hypothetical protein